ncbi:MAG: hypothetical protein H7A18_10465 [Sinobacteraceae bacterium]|nr:hypothetical protein [Nevskiaceae bacterium]
MRIGFAADAAEGTALYLTRAIDRLAGKAVPLAKASYRQPVIRLAAGYRRLLRGTCFIGITGSVGKTTTKDLAYRALATRFRTVRSHLSNNDLYNTARTILSTPPGTAFCLQELGVDTPGSLDAPLELLRPNLAIVTTIGLDHYRIFRTREAVAAEKTQLVRALDTQGTAVLNADDPHVEAMADACAGRVLRYGRAAHADLRILAVETNWPDGLALQLQWQQGPPARVATALHGEHLATSLAAAITTAIAAGLSLEAACAALQGVEPTTGRLSLARSSDGILWLRDDFKTSQWSVGQAFEYLASCRQGVARRVIVLGTVADRRGKSRDAYSKVLAQAAGRAELVVMVGEHSHYAADVAHRHPDTELRGFATPEAAARWLQSVLRPGDLVLLKGGMKDHLSRLLLARDRPVACWPTRCERMIDCSHCALLAVPTRHDGSAA